MTKKRKPAKPDGVPTYADPFWAQQAPPLLSLLTVRPHTLAEILVWGRTASLNQDMSRQLVAWAEGRGLLGSRKYQGIWYWWRRRNVGPDWSNVQALS